MTIEHPGAPHPSPVEDTGEPDAFTLEAAKGVHSAFNACMYREQCRAALAAPTPSTQAVGAPWQVGDDTSSVQISRDGSTHKWGCKCEGCVPTTGSAPDVFDQGCPSTQAVNTRILNLASPAIIEPVEFESALAELVNKIDTSLDSGDLLIDARRASAALDAILTKGDLVANAHDYFRDSPGRYENSVEFGIGWNACLDAISAARALLAASMGEKS